MQKKRRPLLTSSTCFHYNDNEPNFSSNRFMSSSAHITFFTARADCRNKSISFASSLRSITFSPPCSPSTTGTPKWRPRNPYSPSNAPLPVPSPPQTHQAHTTPTSPSNLQSLLPPAWYAPQSPTNAPPLSTRKQESLLRSCSAEAVPSCRRDHQAATPAHRADSHEAHRL